MDPVSRVAFTNMRRLRKGRRWSAQVLSEHLANAGCPTSRLVLTNQENGRVASMPLPQAVALAAVFGIPLTDLIVPPCETCSGIPPAGFTCNECGRNSS